MSPPEARRAPRRTRGALLLVVSALAFAGMTFTTKLASARLPAAEVAGFRFALNLAAVAVLNLAGMIAVPVPRAQIPLLLTRGFLGGIAVVLFFVAIAHGRVGTATLLNFTSPAFTAVFAWIFLGERLSRWLVAAFLLASCGVVLVWRGSAADASLQLWGWQSLGLLSALFAGGAVTAIRALRCYQAAPAWTVFTFFCACGLCCSLPLALPRLVIPTAGEWGLLLLVAWFSIVGQILMTHALGFVSAALAGVIHQLTVVASFVLGFVFLGDPVLPLAMLGAVLTIAGVAWAAWLSRGESRLD